MTVQDRPRPADADLPEGPSRRRRRRPVRRCIAGAVLFVLMCGWSMWQTGSGEHAVGNLIGWAAGVMVVALACVIGFRLVGDLRLRPPERPERVPATFTRGELAIAFMAAVVVQLAVLYFAFLTAQGGGSFAEFRELFDERLTESGDSPHYLFLAEHGYQNDGEESLFLVFFPLYPSAIWLLHWVCGGYVAAALVVSWLSWGAAVATLLVLAGRWYGRERAVLAAALLTLFPFSFFSVGVFAESLFILLCAQCLLRIDQRQWGWAGLFGLLAALCRSQGALLVVPTVLAWGVARRREGPQGRGSWAIPGAAVGFGIYLVINRVVSGDWTRFTRYQADHWNQRSRWIGENVRSHYENIDAYPDLAMTVWGPNLVLFFVMAALLTYGCLNRAPTYLLAFGLSYLVMSYSASWLLSGPRYMFACLPLVLLAARPPAAAWRAVVPVVSGVLLCGYAALLMGGSYIV